MKFIKIASAATVVLVLTLLTGVVAPASHAEVSFGFFYSDLSPHGSWLVSGEYGRVWQPTVYRHGWNPYYDGHWVYTDCGWSWVSDYTWGDVAYHYGTWVDDPYHGWVWVPGYTWAPAWVTFRTGPDYIGWAPVPPSFSVGFSSGGFAFGASIPVASTAFVFVPTREFAAPRLRSYIVPESRRTTIINNTTIVNNLTVQNNVVINRGPDLRTIERATRRTFRPQPIERVARAAPFTSFRREQLAVARDMGRDRVRAAEPVTAQQPLPRRMSDRERRDYRRNPELSQAPRNDQFRTPTETEAQLRQDRAPQRQPQRELDQHRQRQPELQQQQRRQQEVQPQRDQQVQQERKQQELQPQRQQYQQPRIQEQRRQQEVQQQRNEQVQQDKRQQEIERQRQQPRDQRNQRAQPQQPNQQQRATAPPRQGQQKEQPPQKPKRRTPKTKNPDEKQGDGGGNS